MEEKDQLINRETGCRALQRTERHGLWAETSGTSGKSRDRTTTAEFIIVRICWSIDCLQAGFCCKNRGETSDPLLHRSFYPPCPRVLILLTWMPHPCSAAHLSLRLPRLLSTRPHFSRPSTSTDKHAIRLSVP